MTNQEIQRALRAIQLQNWAFLDSIRKARLEKSISDAKELNLQIHSEIEVDPQWFKFGKRTVEDITQAFTCFTFEEQEEIGKYFHRLINEAYALCLLLQKRCPILTVDGLDGDERQMIERIYRAQYHAIKRLGRRQDDWKWARGHIRKARRRLELPRLELVN